MQRILTVLVALVLLGVPAQDFKTTADTTERWQAEALATYNHAVAQWLNWQTDEAPVPPEPWVEQSPFAVAAGVWQGVSTNLTSSGGGLFLLVHILGGMWRRRRQATQFDRHVAAMSDKELLTALGMALFPASGGYQPAGPPEGNLDVTNPPRGGSGVPR